MFHSYYQCASQLSCQAVLHLHTRPQEPLRSVFVRYHQSKELLLQLRATALA
jgi:hypothetical protein